LDCPDLEDTKAEEDGCSTPVEVLTLLDEFLDHHVSSNSLDPPIADSEQERVATGNATDT